MQAILFFPFLIAVVLASTATAGPQLQLKITIANNASSVVTPAPYGCGALFGANITSGKLPSSIAPGQSATLILENQAPAAAYDVLSFCLPLFLRNTLQISFACTFVMGGQPQWFIAASQTHASGYPLAEIQGDCSVTPQQSAVSFTLNK